MTHVPTNKLPQHRPLIEIDYNDIDAEGNTGFRFTDVQSDIPLIVGQHVTVFQPEDETYTKGVIVNLYGHRPYGKVRVLWNEMKGYTP